MKQPDERGLPPRWVAPAVWGVLIGTLLLCYHLRGNAQMLVGIVGLIVLGAEFLARRPSWIKTNLANAGAKSLF